MLLPHWTFQYIITCTSYAHPNSVRIWDLHRFKKKLRHALIASSDPIHQTFATFWNIYKYHCTVLKHYGKVKHWNSRTNWTTYQRSFLRAIIKRDSNSYFAKEFVDSITDNIFFRMDKKGLCLFFFSGIFSQKVAARGRKTEYFTTMA